MISRKGLFFAMLVSMAVAMPAQADKLDDIIAKHSEAQTGCPITYSYSKKTAKTLAGDGFEIDNIFVDHIFPYQIPKYVKYEYEFVWYFRMLPKSVFR